MYSWEVNHLRGKMELRDTLDVTFLDYFYAYHMQTIIGTALFLYLDPFIRH